MTAAQTLARAIDDHSRALLGQILAGGQGDEFSEGAEVALSEMASLLGALDKTTWYLGAISDVVAEMAGNGDLDAPSVAAGLPSPRTLGRQLRDAMATGDFIAVATIADALERWP